jgi:hypothetical protein
VKRQLPSRLVSEYGGAILSPSYLRITEDMQVVPKKTCCELDGKSHSFTLELANNVFVEFGEAPSAVLYPNNRAIHLGVSKNGAWRGAVRSLVSEYDGVILSPSYMRITDDARVVPK